MTTQIYITEINTSLTVNEKTINSFTFIQDYNEAIKTAAIRLHNLSKKKAPSTQSGKEIEIIIKTLIASISESGSSLVPDMKPSDISDFLEQSLYTTKDFIRITSDTILLNDKKEYTRTFNLLTKIAMNILKHAYSRLNSPAHQLYTDIELNNLHKKARSYISRSKSKNVKAVLTALELYPFGPYYFDLMKHCQLSESIEKIVEFAGAVNDRAYSYAVKAASSRYFSLNSEALFTYYQNREWDKLDALFSKYYWFEKESFVEQLIHYILETQDSDFMMNYDNVKQFEEFCKDLEYIPGLEKLNKIVNAVTKIKNISDDESLMQAGISILRKRKLLKHAKAFEQRTGFLDLYLYTGLVTATVGSALIWSAFTGLIAYLITIFTSIKLHNNYLFTQSIVTSISGAFYGFYEWFLYFKEFDAWREITDDGRISIGLAEREMDDFYKKHLDIEI